MSKETLVNKSETFEDWRLKSNEVSLDLGAVASDATYTAPSLDTESRLTDQYITKSDLGDGGLYIRDLNDFGRCDLCDFRPASTRRIFLE